MISALLKRLSLSSGCSPRCHTLATARRSEHASSPQEPGRRPSGALCSRKAGQLHPPARLSCHQNLHLRTQLQLQFEPTAQAHKSADPITWPLTVPVACCLLSPPPCCSLSFKFEFELEFKSAFELCSRSSSFSRSSSCRPRIGLGRAGARCSVIIYSFITRQSRARGSQVVD